MLAVSARVQAYPLRKCSLLFVAFSPLNCQALVGLISRLLSNYPDFRAIDFSGLCPLQNCIFRKSTSNISCIAPVSNPKHPKRGELFHRGKGFGRCKYPNFRSLGIYGSLVPENNPRNSPPKGGSICNFREYINKPLPEPQELSSYYGDRLARVVGEPWPGLPNMGGESENGYTFVPTTPQRKIQRTWSANGSTASGCIGRKDREDFDTTPYKIPSYARECDSIRHSE